MFQFIFIKTYFNQYTNNYLLNVREIYNFLQLSQKKNYFILNKFQRRQIPVIEYFITFFIFETHNQPISLNNLNKDNSPSSDKNPGFRVFFTHYLFRSFRPTRGFSRFPSKRFSSSDLVAHFHEAGLNILTSSTPRIDSGKVGRVFSWHILFAVALGRSRDLPFVSAFIQDESLLFNEQFLAGYFYYLF